MKPIRHHTAATIRQEHLDKIAELLEANGCDCPCDHHHEEHDDLCDRCLACRIEAALLIDDPGPVTIIGAADYPALGITDATQAPDVLAALLAERPKPSPVTIRIDTAHAGDLSALNRATEANARILEALAQKPERVGPSQYECADCREPLAGLGANVHECPQDAPQSTPTPEGPETRASASGASTGAAGRHGVEIRPLLYCERCGCRHSAGSCPPDPVDMPAQAWSEDGEPICFACKGPTEIGYPVCGRCDCAMDRRR